MKLNELIFEREMAEIAAEFNAARNELNTDINVRVVLKQVAEFIIKWRSFADKFDITNTKITQIKAAGDNIIKFIKNRIKHLQEVSQLDKVELVPLEEYLRDFQYEMEAYLAKQNKEYYAKSSHRK